MKNQPKRYKTAKISVVIPAYRAEKIIEPTLLKVRNVLEEIRYSYEIICVVDGRVDKTLEVAQKIAKKFPEIVVYGYEKL